MKKVYNIYCDESCHLLNDHNKTFVLGAVWIENGQAKKAFDDLRELKRKHNLSEKFETKWTKVSESKSEYYCDIVKYFFENKDIHFRGLIVPDKNILNHPAYAQDHDTWYYKMFYLLLKVIIKEASEYNLYLDMKDTKSHLKVLELQRILNIASVEDVAVPKAQQIRSHEVELMQMADLLIGALSYAHRSLDTNEGKNKVLKIIETSIGKKVLTSSEKNEDKFNVFVWKPRK